MPDLSQFSYDNLDSCHADLSKVFLRVAEITNIRVLVGKRNEIEQNIAYSTGHSKKQWPDSLHNLSPSLAIDVAPYPINYEGTEKRRFYHLAGIVETVAFDMEVDLRWGGDWDRDHDFSDQSFDDLGHWSLVNHA